MNPEEQFRFHIQQIIKLGGDLDKAFVKEQIEELNRVFFTPELPEMPDIFSEMFESWMKRDGIL